MKKKHHGTLSVALVGLLVSALSACGSSDKPTSTSSDGTSSSADQAYVAKAKAFVAAHLKPAPFDAGTAYTPTPGKTIGIISAYQSSSINADIVAAAQQAAEAVDWKTIVFDGKGKPANWNTGIQQFVQQGVDGIFDVAIADNAVPQALDAAFGAHIPVITIGSGTQASKPVEHPSFVSTDLDYNLIGEMDGYYMVAASNGKAKVAFYTIQAIPSVYEVSMVAKDILKQCAGCKMQDSIEFGIPPNFTAAAATQTQSLLSRFGKGQLDYISPPLDIQTQGVTQALTASSRSEVKVVATGCTPGETPGTDQIRRGGPVVFCDTPPNAWDAWAAVDQMGRHFAGLPTSSLHVPLTFWDTDNLTSTTPDEPSSYHPFDFVAYYEKLWGVPK